MKKITIISNFGDGRRVERLGIAILAIGATVLATYSFCWARELYLGNLEVKIRCHPPLVYRGDDFVVEFDSPHDNFDFGIWPGSVRSRNPDDLFLLAFKPGKNDRIAPVIPPQQFAPMKQITLNPATARGSLSNWWRGREVPRALKPPELIFTDSGAYEVLLGAALGAEDANYDACYVDYVNEEKQAGAPLEVEALYDVIRNTYRHSCSARTYERAVTCPPPRYIGARGWRLISKATILPTGSESWIRTGSFFYCQLKRSPDRILRVHFPGFGSLPAPKRLTLIRGSPPPRTLSRRCTSKPKAGRYLPGVDGILRSRCPARDAILSPTSAPAGYTTSTLLGSRCGASSVPIPTLF